MQFEYFNYARQKGRLPSLSDYYEPGLWSWLCFHSLIYKTGRKTKKLKKGPTASERARGTGPWPRSTVPWPCPWAPGSAVVFNTRSDP